MRNNMDVVTAQPYYYTDSTFQLELNLQELRRNLIKVLDKFERSGCLVCNKLKCSCTDQHNATSTPDTNSEGTPTDAELKIEQVKAEIGKNIENIDTNDSNGTSKEHLSHCKEVEEWVEAYDPNPEAKDSSLKPIHGLVTQNKYSPKALLEQPSIYSPKNLNESWPPLTKSKIDKTEVYFHGLISRNADLLRYNVGSPVEAFFRRFSQARQVYLPGQVVSQNVSTGLANAMTYRMKLVGHKVPTYRYL